MKTSPPSITKSQKQIILFLLKFRFTTISQLQKYFTHKDSKRIKEWLKDLKNKKYITAIVDSKDITKPYIFCLASGARQILKENKNITDDFLNKLYKEKKLSSLFQNHCLFLVDIYLFFLAHKEKDAKVVFCTKHDLTGFDYLPEDLDAYIAVENTHGTKRYFLELFDDYQNRQSPGKIRFTIRKYITYCEDGSWQAATNNSPLPSILFVLPNERRRQFTFHYSKAKLSKTFEDISLFLTTQDTIRFSKNGENTWQKVVTTD
jgi:hypothetical protein